jgi:hypothetical protein
MRERREEADSHVVKKQFSELTAAERAKNVMMVIQVPLKGPDVGRAPSASAPPLTPAMIAELSKGSFTIEVLVGFVDFA